MWTDFSSATGPVFATEPVHTNGPQPQQNQGKGPEGPEGPEIDSIGDAGNSFAPTVGDWVLPLSGDGVIIPDTDVPPPYLIRTIEQGPDGLLYAVFFGNGKYWPLAQCERADPPAHANVTPASDADEFDEVII